MALLGYARDDIFDGWCAARNVDPRALPAPRLVNLAYYQLIEGLDRNGREAFDTKLDEIGALYPNPWEAPPKPRAPAEVGPGGIWKKAPVGWKPAGWKSDSENYANIKATGLI